MKRSRQNIPEVERLIHIGKGKGYLTCDEVDEHLPSDILSRDQMDEVGQRFDITRERVRQIEAKALRRLRHPRRSKQLKDFV